MLMAITRGMSSALFLATVLTAITGGVTEIADSGGADDTCLLAWRSDVHGVAKVPEITNEEIPEITKEEEEEIPEITREEQEGSDGASIDMMIQCNQTNKQKALYAQTTQEPSLKSSPAVDAVGDTYWDYLEGLRAYGHRGIFLAFPVGWGRGAPSGYFGPQATGRGDPDVEQVLFSLWDYKRFGEDGWHPALPVLGGVGEDVANCESFNAWRNPGKACCKRNCNDCREEQTTGTQCKIYIPARSGMHLRSRIRRVATNRTQEYANMSWTGDVWEVTIQDMASGQQWLVGRQMLSGTSGGIQYLASFYEHIGCTFCDSFYAEVRRGGPWILEREDGSTESALMAAKSKFKLADPPYTCKNHLIEGSEPVGTFRIKSGPGVPEASGDGTWDKELYTCGQEGCPAPTVS